MKYFLTLFISALVLTGCNDGDLITENFNFDSATIQKCSSSNLYKINGQEALVLNTSEENFPNQETPAGEPRVLPINSATSIYYRKYSGTVSSNSICESPAPATPVVLEEWNVVGGTVQITTNKVFAADGITVIAYNHNIVFKNITFVTNGKQLVYETFVFGNYRTDVIVLPFNFGSSATQDCSTNNLVFKYNTNEVLLLDVDASLFANAETLGTPRTALINSTNKVVYRIYNGNLNANFFCASIAPTSPTVTEEWVAQNGVADTSGIIKVETVAIDAVTFKHTITLYKTTFQKGIYTYSPSTTDEYIFGDYITTL